LTIGGSGNVRIWVQLNRTSLIVNTNRASGLPLNTITLNADYNLYNSIYVGIDWTANIMRVISHGVVTDLNLTNGSASTTSGAIPFIASFNSSSNHCGCNIQSIFYSQNASGNIMSIETAKKYINYLNVYK
jgi:hypothetical protein